MRFLVLGVSEFRVSGCFCLSGFWLPQFRVSKFRGSGVLGLRGSGWFRGSRLLGLKLLYASLFMRLAFLGKGFLDSGVCGLGFWV